MMLIPRGMGLTCPPGQSPTNMYDGSIKCCGGATCEEDPCCILNNPGFIAQQNAQIAEDIATAGPIENSTLLALTSVPVNIGQDAVRCQSNPGATFVDQMGVTVTCPSAQHSDITTGGQPMSNYSTADLARMLNAQYGSVSPMLPGNVPFQTTPAAVIKSVAPAPGPAIANTAGGGAAGTPGTSAGGGSTTAGGGPTNIGGGSTVDLSFLTNSSLINGIPNWMVGFGGLAILLILPSLMGGRR